MASARHLLAPRLWVERFLLSSNARAVSSSASHGKLYELRTYSVEPSKLTALLQLTKENFYLRTNHSRLIGYWTTELGGLNEVVHLWEYDSYDHRTNVRKALSVDKNWIETYLSKAAPMMSKQTNAVLHPLAWCPPKFESKKDSNVYELVCSNVTQGRVPEWEEIIQTGWNTRLRYSAQPVGLFRSYYGVLDNVYQLWAYDSFDHQKEVNDKLMADEDWRETERNLALYTSSSWRKGLAPVAGVSPLQ